MIVSPLMFVVVMGLVFLAGHILTVGAIALILKVDRWLGVEDKKR